MKQRFLLIGYNFQPELTGIGKYSGEMVRWLAEKGYDCTVITAYPYYPHWKVQEPYAKRRFWYTTEREAFGSGGSIATCRCPMYVPARPSGLKRILLDATFLATAFFRLLPLLWGRPCATVFVVAPSFQFGLLGVLYKKLKKAAFIYHIQDLQIEAARDLQLIKSARVLKALFGLEKYILDQADVVSSISAGMIRRIQAKTSKPVTFFPNWTDTTQFHPIDDKAALKKEFGFAPSDKIILYAGAIGEKQGLASIVWAAHAHRQQPGWQFVICGTGPYQPALEGMARQLGLANVSFFPLQSLDKFNRFLNAADVHLVIQKASASDLVMPSKLTTILAVGGLAVITANEESNFYALVKAHDIGILVPAEDQLALNHGIAQALCHNDGAVARNARAYAEQHLSIDVVMEAFTRLLAGGPGQG